MIDIAGLTQRFGDQTVLDGVDLHVGAGQIAAVVGPSGAGKSTLARCINLLQVPTSGSIRVDGREVAHLSARELRGARRRIGTVFQSAGLLRQLTAAQNIALPLRYTRATPAEQQRKVRELLDRVGLLDRAGRYPSQLSGGQRQRVGLARGLVLEPSVLLADEPTSGLDPASTSSILELLARLRDDLGVTVVLITHEMDVVRRVADTVSRLERGRIVESGPVDEVVRRTGSALARALLPAPVTRVAPAGHGLWQVRYAAANVAPTWITQIGRELGTDIAVLAGLIEEVRGSDAGHLTVAIDEAIDAARIARVFADHGLAAHRSQPAALADPAPAATAASGDASPAALALTGASR